MLLFTVFTYALTLAMAKSDLKIVFPAVYLKNFEEACGSNRSLYVWPGMRMDTELSKRKLIYNHKLGNRLIRSFKEPISEAYIQRHIIRAIRRKKSEISLREDRNFQQLRRNYRQLRQGIGILEGILAASNVAGWMCYNDKYSPKIEATIMRADIPGLSPGNGMGISRNISEPVRMRLRRVAYAMFESGSTERPVSPSRSLDLDGIQSRGKNVPCFDRIFSNSKNQEPTTSDLPLSAYEDFLKTISFYFMMSFVVAVTEIFVKRHQVKKQRILQQRIECRRLSSATRKQVRKLQVPVRSGLQRRRKIHSD